jgi:hypothetical protein
MNPRQPKPESKRDEDAERRALAQANPVLDLVNDDSGISGIAVGAVAVVVGIIVVFFGRIVVLKQNAKADAVCEDIYADDASAEASCKSDNNDFVTFGGLGLLLALIGVAGLGAKKKGYI